jgi:hypothetical protein
MDRGAPRGDVLEAMHTRVNATGTRTLALFERVTAAGLDAFGEAIDASVLTAAEVEAATDVLR